jgi:hypothetical protein
LQETIAVLEEQSILLNNAWVDSAGEVNHLRFDNNSLTQEIELLKRQNQQLQAGNRVLQSQYAEIQKKLFVESGGKAAAMLKDILRDLSPVKTVRVYSSQSES